MFGIRSPPQTVPKIGFGDGWGRTTIITPGWMCPRLLRFARFSNNASPTPLPSRTALRGRCRRESRSSTGCCRAADFRWGESRYASRAAGPRPCFALHVRTSWPAAIARHGSTAHAPSAAHSGTTVRCSFALTVTHMRSAPPTSFFAPVGFSSWCSRACTRRIRKPCDSCALCTTAAARSRRSHKTRRWLRSVSRRRSTAANGRSIRSANPRSLKRCTCACTRAHSAGTSTRLSRYR